MACRQPVPRTGPSNLRLCGGEVFSQLSHPPPGCSPIAGLRTLRGKHQRCLFCSRIYPQTVRLLPAPCQAGEIRQGIHSNDTEARLGTRPYVFEGVPTARATTNGVGGPVRVQFFPTCCRKTTFVGYVTNAYPGFFDQVSEIDLATRSARLVGLTGGTLRTAPDSA